MDINTYTTVELTDGTKLKTTLTFSRLLKLRASDQHKGVYGRYNRIQMNGVKEEIDFATVLYAAYLCASADDLEGCMAEEEFYELLPQDRPYIIERYVGLVNPKALAASATSSAAARSEEPRAGSGSPIHRLKTFLTRTRSTSES